jgi:hypothetical protein
MPVIETQIRTLTCDGKECDKTITYDMKTHNQVILDPVNAWLLNTRIVSTADGRNLVFCSSLCEASAVESGLNDPPQLKKVVSITDVGGSAAIKFAAAAAKKAADATRALKEGQNVNLG